MINLKLKKTLTAAVFTGLFSTATQAATWDITVTNLTHGNHFTPLFLQTHDTNSQLYQLGQAASSAVELMAECGNNSELVTAAGSGNFIDNPAAGVLAPGSSTSTTINTAATGETHLSVVAMILPTNDAFIGMNSQLIPTTAGTYTYYINGYDAGTEANDEILNAGGSCNSTTPGMPGAPGGDTDSGASGAAGTDSNANIHVHRGTLGEATASGSGNSDLINSIHRWQNPVAKIIVTVTP